MQPRVRGGEGAFGFPGVTGEQLQGFDELGVGVGHRWAALLASIGVGEPDLVVAVDLDVLDVGVVDERLQPAQAEQCGHHGVGERVLLVHGPRLLAVVHPLDAPTGEDIGEQCPTELAPSLRIGQWFGLQPGSELLGHLAPYLTDQLMVDVGRRHDRG